MSTAEIQAQIDLLNSKIVMVAKQRALRTIQQPIQDANQDAQMANQLATLEEELAAAQG